MIFGKEQVFAKMREIGGAASRRALAAAIYQEAEALIAEAKAETPVDTGALRASGFVQQPEITDDEITIRCGFGGAAAGYALIVHENLEAFHPIGGAKFLENPAKRREEGLEERVGRRYADEIFK